ncbi:DinB family protein [Ornithinibacillus gellani]|uniref:DinB family protein n=1 Tax=Ornithinibacillus gellani TaxID=2293253 RepID=UPI000F4A4840|nr:DinB family protein [Ornithinibacillus gellani]TQS74164.1 DinB family protein [Ornithinibacillus gellani]
MNENREIIHRFEQYVCWLISLKDMDERLWHAPIAKGKWTVNEVICHIMKWDRYLLSDVIPASALSQSIFFPDHDAYNEKASIYAKSGIKQIEMIEEAIVTRKLLANELLKCTDETLEKPLLANGESHCPLTGEPYSLIKFIKDFIYHDEHHQKQITGLLTENSPA